MKSLEKIFPVTFSTENNSKSRQEYDTERTVATSIAAIVPAETSARRSSRSSSIGQRGKSPSVGIPASCTSTVLADKNLNIASNRMVLPRSLKDQIQINNDTELAPSARLQNVATSKANKWRKGTPEKNDMRSVLEKRFGQIR